MLINLPWFSGLEHSAVNGARDDAARGGEVHGVLDKPYVLGGPKLCDRGYTVEVVADGGGRPQQPVVRDLVQRRRTMRGHDLGQ